MIHLGQSDEVLLEKSDVEAVEQRLDEILYIAENSIEGNDLTDVKNKIRAIEYNIQSNRL